MHKPSSKPFSRRHLLQAVTCSASLWAAPGLWAQSPIATKNIAVDAYGERATGQFGTQGRLVIVFLRGAYDGLSAFVPHGDSHYYSLRPTIAIPAPGGTTQSTIALDERFGLHPAMAALLPLWQ